MHEHAYAMDRRKSRLGCQFVETDIFGKPRVHQGARAAQGARPPLAVANGTPPKRQSAAMISQLTTHSARQHVRPFIRFGPKGPELPQR